MLPPSLCGLAHEVDSTILLSQLQKPRAGHFLDLPQVRHLEMLRCFDDFKHNVTCLAAVPVARMSTGVRASLVDKVKEMAQKHKVVVFAKSYCPYCMQVGLCLPVDLYMLLLVCSIALC